MNYLEIQIELYHNIIKSNYFENSEIQGHDNMEAQAQ